MTQKSELDQETYRLVQEAMESGKSKEEFREFLKQKKLEKHKEEEQK